QHDHTMICMVLVMGARRNLPLRRLVGLVRSVVLLVGILSLVAAPPSARAAGDGHDHGGGAGARGPTAPRAEARIADKQIVLVYAGGRLLAFIEGFADGVPTRGAELEAVINFLPEAFAEVAPGIYQSGP